MHIDKLSLKEGLTKALIRKQLIATRGSYDPEHYKKYRIKEDIDYIMSENNARSLCLHQITKEELEELKNEENTKVEKTENPCQGISCATNFVDFELEKYDYYSVRTMRKRSFSCWTVRVAK